MTPQYFHPLCPNPLADAQSTVRTSYIRLPPVTGYPIPVPPEIARDLRETPAAPKDPPSGPRAPNPRRVPLPLGGECLMYSRENLTQLFGCSHGELGRLLSRKMAPLPIRIDGQILWFCDESLGAQAQVQRAVERWRKR
jgi:hypothetical protein